MSVIQFPNLSAALSSADRGDTIQFCARVPEADLEFAQADDGTPYASFQMAGRWFILQRDRKQVVIHENGVALVKAATAAAALAELPQALLFS